MITGKPIALGGSLGREDATARGGYYLVQPPGPSSDWSRGTRVGDPGLRQCRPAIASPDGPTGTSIVAVSDSKGAIHCPEGPQYWQAPRAKGGRGSVNEPRRVEGISLPAEDLVSVDCELLVPAALEDMIHEAMPPA